MPTTEIDGEDVELAGTTNSNEVVRFGIDSGAAVSVVPMGTAADVAMQGRKHHQFRVADGNIIPEMGTKRLYGRPTSFHVRRVTNKEIEVSVAPVSKALLSVSELVDRGYRLMFDTLSYLEHKETGEVIYLERRAGIYEIEFELEDPVRMGLEDF